MAHPRTGAADAHQCSLMPFRALTQGLLCSQDHYATLLPSLPLLLLPFRSPLYIPFPSSLLPPLPCCQAHHQLQLGFLWAPTAGFRAEPRSQKHFPYILSPEIVSGGNYFGFFCAEQYIQILRRIKNVPVEILLLPQRSHGPCFLSNSRLVHL